VSRSVVIEAPGRLRLRADEPPAPGPGDALVRVAWAGICGSDVDLLAGHRPEGFVRYPVVPGHEWSGTVVAVGPGVEPDLVGRHVVAESIRPCDTCAPCQDGNAPACETRYDETGFTRDGAWADHLTVPAPLVHPLPDGADLRSAAGIEPAACAAAAIDQVTPATGDRVAVVGGGTIGLLATQLLHGAQPSQLVVVEPMRSRWSMAERCGATRVVAQSAAELESSFDVVVEAAGAAGSAQRATDLACRGGRVALAGIPAPQDVVVTQQIVSKQLQVSGVFGAPRHAWLRALEAFRAGDLDPGVLVTHEMPLGDARQALDLVAQRDPGLGKVLLRP
jgi:2-desacetyl-2-hydroxyethyl bacteriochlorophyllide A dehydrogenase